MKLSNFDYFSLFLILYLLFILLLFLPTQTYALSKPVFVQISTVWGTPWGGLSSQKNWSYWDVGDANPDFVYSDGSRRRQIASFNYPVPVKSNVQSDFLEIKINDSSSAGSYPYIGLYDSSNEEVIRYQVRSAKNAGVTAFAVSVADIFADDRKVGGVPVCPANVPFGPGGLDRFKQFLEIASQENFFVFAEVWLPNKLSALSNECGSVDSWIRMIVRIIEEVSSHPSYLKVNGEPVITLCVFNNQKLLDSYLRGIENATNKHVFWLGRILGTYPQNTEWVNSSMLDALAVGSVLRGGMFIKNPDYRLQKGDIVSVKKKGWKTAGMIYPGFDDSFRLTIPSYRSMKYKPMGMARIDGDGKNVFHEQLKNVLDAGADFIWIESWNDYSEQTTIEQSRFVNGVDTFSDPSQNLKILADFMGKSYQDPPLPNLDGLTGDPLIWGKDGILNGKKSDLNNDGKVDIFDYNILVSNFGKTGTSGFIPADINKDGKVDIFDYNILITNFGK